MFITLKKKKLFYFWFGFIFAILFVLNSCFIVRAETENNYVSSDYFFYNYQFSLVDNNWSNAFTSDIFTDSQLNDNPTLQNFIDNVILSKNNCFVQNDANEKFVLCCFNNHYTDVKIISVNIDTNSYNDIMVGYRTKDSFYIYAKKTFSVNEYWINTSTGLYNDHFTINQCSYDNNLQLYYYNVTNTSCYNMTGNFPICYKASGSTDLIAQDYFNNSDDDIYSSSFYEMVNKNLCQYLKNFIGTAVDTYLQSGTYYNNKLDNFTVAYTPQIPEINNLTELNEFYDKIYKLNINYNLNSVQAQHRNSYRINCHYNYYLQFKFYDLPYDAYMQWVDQEYTNSGYVSKDYKRYHACIENFKSRLADNNCTVLKSSVTQQYVEYTSNFNISFNDVLTINNAGNLVSIYELLRNVNYLNPVMSIANMNLGGIYEDNKYYNGYDTASSVTLTSTNSRPVHYTMDGVEYEYYVKGFPDAENLIGKDFIITNRLTCEFNINNNVNNMYKVEFDLSKSLSNITKNTISDNIPVNPTINGNNEEIITNSSNNISNGVNEYGTGVIVGGGSSATGGSSSASGGYGSANSYSGGNNQNVIVQNGLNWNDKPIIGSNINVAQGITNGTSVITQMVNSNGFIPIISSWFSFIPSDFWQLLITVFTIIMMLIVFKFIIWII